MSLSITINHLPAVNFSLQQNRVKVFQSIILKNNDNTAVEDLDIILSFDPVCAPVWSFHVDRIEPNHPFAIKDIEVQFSTDFFINLTESIKGSFRCSVKHHDAILVETTDSITLLTFDQWTGTAVMPEMLAAFVTPNAPIVSRIVKRASEILGKWTKDPSLDAYQQNNPDRIKKMMAALFDAIRELGITYSTHIANYEECGQRIRLSDAIEQDKMANCIDMSALYASCLEFMGLNSLIIIIHGHAFAGCWLIPDVFPDTINDDVSLITKRTAPGFNEILLIEATAMCNGVNSTFDEATEKANYNLVNTSHFVLSVDIARARISQIKALPIRIASENGWVIQPEPEAKEQRHRAPSTLAETDILVDPKSIDTTKQSIWERKLLDLTLRNNLLSVRFSKNTVQLITSHVDQIEDDLADGKGFSILPIPSDWHNPLVDAGMYQALDPDDPVVQLIDVERRQQKLRCYLHEKELKESLTKLYRASRLSLEEIGANTLYLAIGMLKWYENPSSKVPRYAPILLLPVEIVRRSASSGYLIRGRDEDAVVNITLVEMLRQFYNLNIAFNDPLPRDDSGLNVSQIFNTFRHAILNEKGWTVEDMSMLGIFSFNKFVMWNDIHSHSKELARNSIVESLISGRLATEQIPSDEDEDDALEDQFINDGIVLPISADSSQMKAISAALHGKSFILHGPPGTGKSQTITNIIANALYQGQRVLFVAEKMAALQVVQHRLETIGLAPFCLELHSNKAKKSAVLEQLKRTTEVTRRHSNEEYSIRANQLAALRKELGDYEKAIHKVYPFGLSLYDCMSRYANFEKISRSFPIPNSFIDSLNPAKMEDVLLLITEYQSVASIFTHPATHPLKGVNLTDYTPEIQRNIESFIIEVLNEIQNIDSIKAVLKNALGVDIFAVNREERSQIVELLSLMVKRDTIKKEISTSFNDAIFGLDASMVLTQWRIASKEWFLKRMIQQNKVRELLQTYSKMGVKPDRQEVEPLLTTLGDLVQLQKQIDLELQSWPQSSLQIQGNQLALVVNKLTDFNAKEQKLFDMLCLDPARQSEMQSILQLVDGLRLMQSGMKSLREKCVYNVTKSRIVQSGLSILCQEVENETIELSSIVDTYQKSLYQSCAEWILSHESQLNLFHEVSFEGKIEQYKIVCSRLEKLTQEEIAARLSASLPALRQEAANTSEVGILQKNIRNGARGVTLRRLFDQISGILPRMCPCMLMSPMSVAQYIDPTKDMFDLVVFDEASQMPTCEAVGAIARGKNLIVVGDPNQMPPTNFFSSNYFDEDHADKEDLESILDDCLALSLPSMYLKWHYRSKSESLIAFSNVNYYENKLMTFPSPDDLSSKVTYQYVKGVYARGTTRQNKAEAEAVVEEVKRRLSDSETRKYSIGIVTFNTNQQSVIEDLLTEMFEKHPDLEKIAMGMEETIFVKNLENVQGDERDVILFSVGFGPDKNGAFTLNFGPLNRDGGWRRLNVAVTRARYEMKVFSTLRAGDINLNRTSASGVAGLKAFLDFAEKGRDALVYNTASSNVTKDGVVNAVAEALRERGHEVRTRIGCSGYKIDMGIVDPRNPSCYALGVIFDGYNYDAAKTTRDREIVQPGVLNGLGWKLCRVWAMSWWMYPEKVIDDLDAKIKEILSGDSDSPSSPCKEEVADICDRMEPAFESPLIEDNPYVAEYQKAELEPTTIFADNLAAGNELGEIKKRLSAVVECEAPVSRTVLYKRVMNSVGITRTGTRLAKILDDIMSRLDVQRVQEVGEVFYWRKDQNPSDYRMYRIHSDREPMEIPPQEIVTVAEHIVSEQGTLPTEDLMKEIAYAFGYARLGTNVETAIKRALRLAN